MSSPRFYSWSPPRSRRLLWLVTVFWAIAASFVWVSPYFLIAAGPFLFFLYLSLVKSFASMALSPRFGNFQGRLNTLTFDVFDHHGKVLEIGCSNAHLLIDMHAHFKNLELHGVDTWPREHKNSRRQAERNAQSSGALIQFHHASAAKLPFERHSFNSVISVMTFHQVADVVDKTMSLREAIRVLKVGGCFCFIDLFADTDHYPSHDWIIKAIQESGGKIHKIRPIESLTKIPFSLRGPKAMKYAELIMGTKH